MKSIALGAQAIAAGDAELVVAGGMENMSMVPHYLDGRSGAKFGNIKVQDGMLLDGLTTFTTPRTWGIVQSSALKRKGITREAQDAFAVESYRRATKAWDEGKFQAEVVPVSVPQRRGDDLIVDCDEEYQRSLDKIPALRPAFDREDGHGGKRVHIE